ncbi:MAG: hypothetical protein ACRDDY_16105 [Clostridium sp.]|uniref:hypothetical protein n=1 Tax=Clostridium sp. TaxID=1506 RepID=UPI003EE751C3
MRLNLNNKKYTQNKIHLTFKNNAEEEELYKWLIQKGQIGGIANYIKIEMNKIKKKEENENR